MSATPPPGLKDVFRDESDEGRNPDHELGGRQLASKPARLKPIPKAKGGCDDGRACQGLGAACVGSSERPTARHHRLRQSSGNRAGDLPASGCEDVMAILLTGRMRAVDKDAAVRRLKELQLDAGASKDRQLQASVIVVATQTLEVGADLDFDGLVTECASLDAPRQRFGRLNRMGRRIDAKAAILIRADQAKPINARRGRWWRRTRTRERARLRARRLQRNPGRTRRAVERATGHSVRYDRRPDQRRQPYRRRRLRPAGAASCLRRNRRAGTSIRHGGRLHRSGRHAGESARLGREPGRHGDRRGKLDRQDVLDQIEPLGGTTS